MNDRSVYIVEWKFAGRGWRFFFTAESEQVAKDYLDMFDNKPGRWYESGGNQMVRIRRDDGTYESIRIRRSSMVTAGEVADQKAWRAARKAVTA